MTDVSAQEDQPDEEQKVDVADGDERAGDDEDDVQLHGQSDFARRGTGVAF